MNNDYNENMSLETKNTNKHPEAIDDLSTMAGNTLGSATSGNTSKSKTAAAVKIIALQFHKEAEEKAEESKKEIEALRDQLAKLTGLKNPSELEKSDSSSSVSSLESGNMFDTPFGSKEKYARQKEANDKLDLLKGLRDSYEDEFENPKHNQRKFDSQIQTASYADDGLDEMEVTHHDEDIVVLSDHELDGENSDETNSKEGESQEEGDNSDETSSKEEEHQEIASPARVRKGRVPVQGTSLNAIGKLTVWSFILLFDR